MTRARLLLPILLAAFRSAVPVEARGQDLADSIRALDSAWARAYATHDTTLALTLFAEDLVVTSANGSLKDKAAELADIRPQPGLQMQFFRTTDVTVRMYTGAAVVAGLAEWQFTLNGQVSTIRRRYTSMFVAGGALGWQMAGLHMGRAAGS